MAKSPLPGRGGRNGLRLHIVAATALVNACLASVGTAHADGRHAALVVDANSGVILHESSAGALRHPASLAKLMTLYLVFEQIERGRLTHATRIKFSREATSVAPTKLDLETGQEIALGDALRALITKSANDVAVAIAEHIAGSESRFAALMTERARQIGMKDSVFRNASGLPDAAQVTTARDMIMLALRLQDDFPQHYGLFQTRNFAYQGNSYRNHNSLLFNFQGTDGIKTGYTRMSGFNLVTSVRRDGKHVVGAVFGGTSAGARDAYMRALLSKALDKASTTKTRRPTPQLIARARPVPVPMPASRPRPEPKLAGPIPPPAPLPASRPLAPSTAILPPVPVEVSRGRLASEAASSRSGVTTSALPPVAMSGSPGAPPATLQVQAERLARGAPAIPPTPLVHSASTRSALADQTGRLEIQVGAYSSSTEAHRQLALARASLPQHLRSHRSLVVPPARDGQPVYRARFAGFNPAAGATACLELRRQGVDCFVLRAQ